MAEYPLWVWLPNQVTPVLAGIFAYADRQGAFMYDDAYLAHQDALPLDPIALPLKRGWIKELNQDGIFGVIQDSGPDSWGKLLMKHATGESPSDIEAILQCVGDGAGCIALGDIDTKAQYQAPDASLLLKVADYFKQVENDEHMEYVDLPEELLQVVKPATSLGGAKPKITVQDDNALWIAKLPERGDSPYIACFESAMLNLATKCGIAASESKVMQIDENRYAILIKRFDRELHANGGWVRHGFASAHTAMQLKKDYLNDRRRSYPNFAFEIGRWCAYAGYDAADQKQQLWRRMLFNALIGNGDDHPRNHALLCKSGVWELSPAFDLVPARITRDTFSLSMPIERKKNGEMSAMVTLDALLLNTAVYGLSKEQAIAILEQMTAEVENGWRDAMLELHVPESVIRTMEPAFSMGKRLQKELS